jgi:UPF0755 protein
MIKRKGQYNWLLLSAIAILLLISVHCYISLLIPSGNSRLPIVVEFQQGVSFYRIAKTLREKGVIRDQGAFTLLARLRGSTKRVKAGEYEFDTSMTAFDVIERLEKGIVVRHFVTIPEGYNIREIGELLEKKGLSQKGRFMAKACERGFLSSIGIDADTAEGYLFPDTYSFTKGMTEEAMIKNMVSRFREVFTDELKRRAGDVGLSLKDLVTLASVVEKETGISTERPVIARVFLNRLNEGIPLQSDPTVIYGIKDFNGNLTKDDLLTETPYNTYLKRGLPPGPISNPGIDSIKAVLYPEDAPYLYFVSKNDGTHYFSRTLSEHNRAVRLYQVNNRR